MINQSGKRINLHSKDDIPYLIPGNNSESQDDQLPDAPAVVGEDGMVMLILQTKKMRFPVVKLTKLMMKE